MKSCLIIGNSHVAALKQAYDKLLEINLKCDFISRAMGEGGLSGIEIAKNKIHTDFLSNNGFKFHFNNEINQSEILINSYDAIIIVGLEQSTFDYRQYSKGFLMALAKSIADSNDTQFSRLIKKVRSQFSGTVYIFEKPIPANNKRVMSYEDYSDSIYHFNNKYLSEFGVKIIPQARGTMTDNLTVTDETFLASSKDYTHMNSCFGIQQISCLESELT